MLNLLDGRLSDEDLVREIHRYLRVTPGRCWYPIAFSVRHTHIELMDGEFNRRFVMADEFPNLKVEVNEDKPR